MDDSCTMDLPPLGFYGSNSRLASYALPMFASAAELSRLDSALSFPPRFTSNAPLPLFQTNDHPHDFTRQTSNLPLFYSQPLANRTISSNSFSRQYSAPKSQAGDLFHSNALTNAMSNAAMTNNTMTSTSPSISNSPSNANAGDASGEWHCSYGCGKVYRKSSGRSIRRHVVACFRERWPGGESMSEKELSSLIAAQQDQGLLVTGLRRWRMRQSRRAAHELNEGEKWVCPWECGKFYRSTSSRSIQRHATTCSKRLNSDRTSKSRRSKVVCSDASNDDSDSGSGDDAHVVVKSELSASPAMSSTESSSSSGSDRHVPAPVQHTMDIVEPSRLIEQKREIAMQLQALVRDIHSRHGLNHPLFSSSLMTPALIHSLITQNIDNTTPNEIIDNLVASMTGPSLPPAAPVQPIASPPQQQHQHQQHQHQQHHSPPASTSALMWTCECGASFKITSSKSMQKHRMLCEQAQDNIKNES